MKPPLSAYDLFLDVFEGAATITLKPGDVLVRAGEQADRVFNLLNGMVRLIRHGGDGRRQILGFLVRGNFIGVTSTGDYFFSVEAVTAVEVATCSRTVLTDRLATDPEAERTYMNMMYRVLENAYDHVYNLGQRTAVERLAVFLLYLRHWHRLSDNIIDDRDPRLRQVALPMGREDIADFLGLKKETVSRGFRQLEDRGLIHRDRHGLVSIRNLTELRKMAGIRDFASPRRLSAKPLS